MAALPEVDTPVTAELERELARQADTLIARISDGRERLAVLVELTAAVRAQLDADEQLLRSLDSLLGRPGQLPLESLDARLRGARLREIAVRILAERAQSEPVHYRQWYEWLREAGYTVAGHDPLASFLAQITRAPEVQRVGGQRSGRYQLRQGLGTRLHEVPESAPIGH